MKSIPSFLNSNDASISRALTPAITSRIHNQMVALLSRFGVSAAVVALLALAPISREAFAQQADAKEQSVTVILDADGDGWDDLWCAIYPALTHRDRTADTDKDGVTDYEAMLHWKSPFLNAKPPTEEEKRAAAAEALRLAVVAERTRQEEWKRQQIAMAPFAVLPFVDEKGEYATRETIAEEKKAALAALAQQEAGKAAAARVRVDDFTRQQGFDKYFITPQGGVAALVDVVGGQPQSYVTHNVNAADTISTDEVRTGGNLGLTLTGDNFLVGLWDGAMSLLVTRSSPAATTSSWTGMA